MAKGKSRVEDDEEGTKPSRSRRRRRRGRSFVGMILLGFVMLASAVIWRRSYGITQARQLADLERQRTQRESELIRLRSRIRDESGRSQLAPALQSLGMHVPNDQQVRMLSR